MDPQQAWKDLSVAIDSDEWGRAGEVADDLIRWLAAEGFPPENTGNKKFDTIVARAARESIASWEVV